MTSISLCDLNTKGITIEFGRTKGKKAYENALNWRDEDIER